VAAADEIRPKGSRPAGQSRCGRTRPARSGSSGARARARRLPGARDFRRSIAFLFDVSAHDLGPSRSPSPDITMYHPTEWTRAAVGCRSRAARGQCPLRRLQRRGGQRIIPLARRGLVPSDQEGPQRGIPWRAQSFPTSRRIQSGRPATGAEPVYATSRYFSRPCREVAAYTRIEGGWRPDARPVKYPPHAGIKARGRGGTSTTRLVRQERRPRRRPPAKLGQRHALKDKSVPGPACR